MTFEESFVLMHNEIECIKRAKDCDRDCGKCELVKNDQELIEAFQFAKEAIQKQIPKKPSGMKDLADLIIAYCPTCGDGINSEYPYCSHCGQKILWI